MLSFFFFEGYSGGFPAGVPGAQQPTMSAGGSAGGAPGGYPDYNRMQGQQAGPPGPPNVEGGAAPSDYSSFGKSSPFGNFFYLLRSAALGGMRKSRVKTLVYGLLLA